MKQSSVDTYTPGPWCVEKKIHRTRSGSVSSVTHLYVKSSAGSDVCNLYGIYEEGRANGNLISAAPEMLKALEKCLDVLTEMEGETGGKMSEAELVRAALKKARGQS